MTRRDDRWFTRTMRRYDGWNNDPTKGSWTGYDLIEAQMRAGDVMASHPCVDPRTPEQYAAYHRLQNLAPTLGYERRPPAPHGLGLVHIHFERTTRGAPNDTANAEAGE